MAVKRKETNHFFEFGPFRVNTADRLLLRGDEVVPLTPKAYETLLALVENSGHILEKDALMKTLWPDTFVEEGSLTQNISLVRKALGEAETGQKYIETIPKRGYRFSATVREVREPSAEQSTKETPEAEQGVKTARRLPDQRPWLALAAAALLLAAALGAWLAARSARFRRPPLSSIAVLPFENLSHNPSEEWFSDGMTEILITELSKVHSLKVISRTSGMQYKGTHKLLKQIGTELGVDAVVEGSALRVGDRVRITAQLIATASDTHVWGNDFDAEMKDVLSLQRSVAEAIAHQVGAALAAGTRTRRDANPQAMAAYLKGLYQFNRGDLPAAIDLAREAIRIDPQLALAHELRGMTLHLAADFHGTTYAAIVPEGRAALQRALELEPDRGASLSWLGWSYFAADHNWVQGEAYLRRGFELDPSTGNNYAVLLAAQGRYDEAIRAVEQALLHDPVNPLLLTDAGHAYQWARRYDEAVRFYRQALALSPTYAYAHVYLPAGLLLARRPDEAFEAWLWTPDGRGPLEMGNEFRKIYGMGGWPAVWRTYLERLPKNRRTDTRLWALVFLHRNQETLDYLEELERSSDSWMIQLEDPIFDLVRQEPRFQEVLRRVGYPRSMWQ